MIFHRRAEANVAPNAVDFAGHRIQHRREAGKGGIAPGGHYRHVAGGRFHRLNTQADAAISAPTETTGMKAGVVINPGTPVEALIPVLDLVDQVLIMTVNPGFGGQAFIPEMMSKVERVVGAS